MVINMFVLCIQIKLFIFLYSDSVIVQQREYTGNVDPQKENNDKLFLITNVFLFHVYSIKK